MNIVKCMVSELLQNYATYSQLCVCLHSVPGMYSEVEDERYEERR